MIKSAYRRLAFEFHPDRNPGSAQSLRRFLEINEAFSVLKDRHQRGSYSERVSSPPQKSRGRSKIFALALSIGAVIFGILWIKDRSSPPTEIKSGSASQNMLEPLNVDALRNEEKEGVRSAIKRADALYSQGKNSKCLNVLNEMYEQVSAFKQPIELVSKCTIKKPALKKSLNAGGVIHVDNRNLLKTGLFQLELPDDWSCTE